MPNADPPPADGEARLWRLAENPKQFQNSNDKIFKTYPILSVLLVINP
jgi:hypothetical protein